MRFAWRALPADRLRQQPEREATFDNGLFYRAKHRSGRWVSLKPNPSKMPFFGGPGAPRECAYAHYRHVKRLPPEKMKHLRAAIIRENRNSGGFETWGFGPNWFYEWSGWGTLMKRRLPVMGICRGCQLINVYFGGTLWQDLPSERPGEIVHRSKELHPIRIEPGSRLAKCLGTDRTDVNTLHHQAVKKLAPGFKATAFAPDGVVEAIESETLPVAGVQFHPE